MLSPEERWNHNLSYILNIQPKEKTVMANKKNNSEQPEQERDQETGALIDQLPPDLDESSMVDEQVGFPPYWTPAEGKRFYARPLLRDERDPKFVRYVLEAGHDITCNEGPHEDAKVVIVRKGEYFTMSNYAALPLERFFGEFVLVTVTGQRELKSTGNDLWTWNAKVDKAAKARIAAARAAQAKALGPAAAIPGLRAPMTEAAKSLPVT